MSDPFKNVVFAEEDIIKFPAGIPGFEKNDSFVLVQIPDYRPFEWLVASDGSMLRFAVVNPMLFKPDYEPKIVKEQLQDLGIEKPEDVLLYVIVTIHDNPADCTANLVGPVVVNKTKRIGKQIIIEDDRYSTQERILREM